MLRPTIWLSIISVILPTTDSRTLFSQEQTAPAASTQNQPPYFTTALDDRTLNFGEAVTISLQATDAENDPFDFTMSAVPSGPPLPPSGVMMDSNTYRWTPTLSNTAGTTHFAVRFRVVDLVHNQESHQDVNFYIGDIQTPPRFLTPEINSQVPEGTPVSVSLQATDPNPADRPNLVFSLNGAPHGATIDPRTGVLAWTPPYTYVTVGRTRPATFIANVTDGIQGNAPASLNIIFTIEDVRIVNQEEWNRGVCQVAADFAEVTSMATTYSNAARNRRRAKTLVGLTAALISVLTPFSDDVGGADLPLAMGIGAAVIGVAAERLPDPGPRERQAAVLMRVQVDLRNAEQVYTRRTTDITDPELLAIRTDALNSRSRAGADLQAVDLTLAPANCR